MAVYINNHIHTTYSFSPYTPTAAAEAAKAAGLETAGIMDHDTCAGAHEFLAAAARVGIPATCGLECRVDMSDTAMAGRRLNNPDQVSIAYVAMHGIPHGNLDAVDATFAPYREKRNLRNRNMIQRIGEAVAPYGIGLDFDRDVLPLACATVTERHLLFALTKKITARFPTPEGVVGFLAGDMGLSLKQKQIDLLLSRDPRCYEYDVLGILKGNLLKKFYVDATDECPPVRTFIETVRKYGGIAAYAYLGDVTDSVTGDKAAQKFEDDYLDELFAELKALGFDAVTFMPTRNTPEQLDRVMRLCREYGFFQISGEDINSPRQSFICRAYEDPRYSHLIDAAFSLIGYENAATENVDAAMKKYAFIFGNR